MSDIASLERMLRSDAALEQARLAQSGAINTQQMLRQPLSNFNAGSLRNPANIPSLERLQASIRVTQYMESGTVTHMPAYVPQPNANASAGSGGGLTPNASSTMASTEATATSTLPRNISLPRQIQLPTTGQLARQARTIGPSLARRLGPALGRGALEAGASYLQAGNDSLNDALRNQLPSDLQPAWDGIAGPNGFLERWLTPPNIAGAREGVRQLQDLDRLRSGLPARSQAGQILEEFNCQLFGVGCPETSPEGVPNLGSPGALPPFYGGQSSVMYSVTVQVNSIDNNGYEAIGTPEIRQVLGPIRGIAKFSVDTPEGNRTEVRLLHAPMVDRPEGETYLGSYLTSAFQSISPRILDIARVDGQPDTGGNPQPETDADNRPATVPALVNPQVFPPAPAPDRPSSTVPNPVTTPPVTTPTAPPGTATPDAPPPDSDKDSPLNPFNPNSPFLPIVRPAAPPTGQRGFNPSGAQQPGQTPSAPRVGTGTQPPSPVCRYDNSNIAGRVDQTNVTLNAVQLFMEQQMMSKLNTIDAKLGPQIPGGGVSVFLGKMFDFAKKTWDFLKVDRILNILTWIGVLHNAFMLSNTLTQSLFAMVTVVLDAFNIEDSEGNPIDVSSEVGKWTEGFFNDLLGEETVDEIQAKWAKWNRIYQAAANLLYSIQSMFYSMAEILEVISNYAGRIGNALKKSGTVLQNSFNWMNTNANYTDNRFFRFLQRTQDGVEIVEQIFSEVVSIQETAAEFYEQSEQFSKEFGKEEGVIAGIEDKVAADQKTEIKISPNHEIKAEAD